MIGVLEKEVMVRNAGQPRSFHEPVLLGETIESLNPGPGKLFFDATVGGGGHTRRLLAAGADVVASDQDPDAISEVLRHLAEFGSRLHLVRANFLEAPHHFTALGVGAFDGILMDLGVSSHQLDTAYRGFSFQEEGPLDMRMGPNITLRAADLVNFAPEEELIDIFRRLGEEPAARRIAAHLVRKRSGKLFQTTTDLAKAVEEVIPRRGPRHPATRVFQALRIAVNNELDVLEQALPALAGWIRPGGRMAVITFHSLEDRIVKHYFRKVSQEWIDRPEWPEPRPNPAFKFKLITTKPIEASPEEKLKNPRSRSAKLRVIERNPL
jgi:16S rRNA (cytosine1402-N4)-methyltransferase